MAPKYIRVKIVRREHAEIDKLASALLLLIREREASGSADESAIANEPVV